MKRKIVSLMLVSAMVFGLTACSGGGDSEGGNSGGGGEGEEPYNIVMQVPTWGQEYSGLADVEAAINAIIEPEINATVTLEPIAAWDIPNTSTLQITSGEKLDLLCIESMGSNMDSISNYVNVNGLTELNDIYDEYGKDIQSCLGNLIDIGYMGETLYAVPANYYAGGGYCFAAITSELEALGFSFDENQIYTLEDVEEVLAAYQESKGSGYYAIAGFADGPLVTNLVPTDDLGDPAIGSLMNGGLDNTTVVNRFATDEYREAYERIRGWNQAGYINPDVISITDTWPTLLASGQYLGAFMYVQSNGLEGIPQNEKTVGQDLTVIRFFPDYATTTKAAYALWAIPVTSENPEKVMEFLNILYQDRELSENVSWLLSAGIEGESYEIVETLDDGRIIIDYPEGLDAATVPYTGSGPIYGDALSAPKYVPVDAEMCDEIVAYNDTSIEYSKAFGYTFDSSEYSNQISAINNVIETYGAQLGFGMVDVDTVLPQFISELEAAGINDVIAANQEQLDAWLAAQE